MNEPAPLSIAITIWQGLWHIAAYSHSGLRVSDHDAGYWSACIPRLPWLREYVSWRPSLTSSTPWQDVPIGVRDSQGVLYMERMLEATSTGEVEALLKLARAVGSGQR
jgi:hypothetical protein